LKPNKQLQAGSLQADPLTDQFSNPASSCCKHQSPTDFQTQQAAASKLISQTDFQTQQTAKHPPASCQQADNKPKMYIPTLDNIH